MAGSVVDLSDPTVLLPEFIILDTSIIVERVIASFGFQPSLANGHKAEQFVQRLLIGDARGIVTPAIYTELLHILVKFQYRSELAKDRVGLTQKFGALSSWIDLYKRDPSILRQMRGRLEQLSDVLTASRVYVLSLSDVNDLASGRGMGATLPETMCRYGLDSTDALILQEAQRIRMLDIATLDADLLRAQNDFKIYTWL